MVHGHAERGADGILPAIALADGILLIVLVGEVVLELVHHLLGHLGQAVLLHERHHGHLDRGERGGNLHHDALLTVLELLDGVGMGHDGEAHAVHADGRLDDVRGVGHILLRIEVFDLLAGELLVVPQVEVRAAVDALELLEAEREVELDVGGGVGVVGQLLMVVEAVVLRAHAEVHMPLHAGFLPLGEPVELCAGLDEELHLHLLELAHAENELPGHDLVTEGLADLRNAERNLHAAGLLDVQVVDENALGRLRTQIDDVRAFGGGAHGGLEHQVELADSVQLQVPLMGQTMLLSMMICRYSARSLAFSAAT